MNKKRFWNVFRYACESGLMDCRECPLERKSLKKCRELRDDYKAFCNWLESEVK